VARDLDNPYGMEFRGRRDRGLKFVRPYRNIGELNPVEQLKLSRHPFEVAQAIIETYSKQGVGSISAVPGELERFKWVGMYPQRQGGDAFMMRIKVPGGVMTAAQVREIGVAADAFAEGPDESPVFGNRYADLTTRQDIQLHWIRIADVPRPAETRRAMSARAPSRASTRKRSSPHCPSPRRFPHSSPATASMRTCRESSRSP
jgi:hypothetical protein